MSESIDGEVRSSSQIVKNANFAFSRIRNRQNEENYLQKIVSLES